jgi:hypothetical protein
MPDFYHIHHLPTQKSQRACVVVHDDPTRLNTSARIHRMLADIFHWDGHRCEEMVAKIKRNRCAVYIGPFEPAEHYAFLISQYFIFGFHVTLEHDKRGIGPTCITTFDTGPCAICKSWPDQACHDPVAFTEQNPESGIRTWYCKRHGEEILMRGHDVRPL